MLGQVHGHIVSELGESSRTDTIFVLTAIVFNLIVLGINSSVSIAAIEEDSTTTYDLILAVFVILTVLLNVVAAAALFLGRRTRRMLLGGLVAMYRDNGVDKYYDPSLMSNYGIRYLLFTGVIATLANHSDHSPLYHPLYQLSVSTPHSRWGVNGFIDPAPASHGTCGWPGPGQPTPSGVPRISRRPYRPRSAGATSSMKSCIPSSVWASGNMNISVSRPRSSRSWQRSIQ